MKEKRRPRNGMQAQQWMRMKKARKLLQELCFACKFAKSENQHPDFIKLCNIMKDELDRMCFVTNKVVYGLLAEGKTRILV